MKEKKWFILTFSILVASIFFIAGITAIIDPFFHYHKPLPFLKYTLYDSRYINDGILKHFDYDAIITGTSMTQNFKTSEFDELWNTTSVKVSCAGASYKEVNENLEQGFKNDIPPRYVLQALDCVWILADKNYMPFAHDTYPWYLHDDILWNDVKYLLNKRVLFKDIVNVFEKTARGEETTSFDIYGSWNDAFTYGKEAVLSTYSRAEMSNEEVCFTEADKLTVEDNIEQNVVKLVKNHPDTKFYLFFTPYSIVHWDELNRRGEIKKQIEAERTAIEKLLEQENIELYSFNNNFELISNLDNYKDTQHYSGEINSKILNWIHNRQYQLTKENYEHYLNEIFNYYSSYDYDSIFNAG